MEKKRKEERKYISKKTSEQLVPAEKRPCRESCKCPSRSLSRNPNSAQARVRAHPLWSPYTLYYSFPDITCGSWPYFQGAERETSLRGTGQRDEEYVLALQLTPKALPIPADERSPTEEWMGCKIAYGQALSF